MIILLTFLSALATILFFGVLASYVLRITRTLERIGGTDSALSKITYGVRAIEVETGGIPRHVTQLNQALTAAAGGLKAIDDTLVRVIDAATKQERGA